MAERIGQLKDFKEAFESKTGRVSSVMEQIHALKQSARDLSDNFGSDTPFLAEVQKELDNLLEQAGQVAVRGGASAKQLYDLGTTMAMKESWLKRSEYISNALNGGSTEPLQNMLGPLLDGKELVTSDVMNIMDILIEQNWKSIPGKFFDTEPRSMEEAKKSFISNIKKSTEAYLFQDPVSLPEKLKKLTGIDSLSESKRILENKNFKFLVGTEANDLESLTSRKDILRAAVTMEKMDNEIQVFREAWKSVFNAEAGTDDVIKSVLGVLRDKSETIGAEAATKNMMPRIFDEMSGAGQDIVPQLQKQLLEKILDKVVSNKTMDFPRVIQALQDDMSPFDQTAMDYIFSKGTGLNSLNDLGRVFDDLKKVAVAFNPIEEMDTGASMARGAAAGAVRDISPLESTKSMGTLLDLMKNKFMLSALLKPTTRSQIEAALDGTIQMSGETVKSLSMDASRVFTKAGTKKAISKIILKEALQSKTEPEYVPGEIYGVPGFFNLKNPKNLPVFLRNRVLEKVQQINRERRMEQGQRNFQKRLNQSSAISQSPIRTSSAMVEASDPPVLPRNIPAPPPPSPSMAQGISTPSFQGGIGSLASSDSITNTINDLDRVGLSFLESTG